METIEMNVQFKLTAAKLWGISVFCALFELLVCVHVLYSINSTPKLLGFFFSFIIFCIINNN